MGPEVANVYTFPCVGCNVPRVYNTLPRWWLLSRVVRLPFFEDD